jgi:preprotein translocase subunit SecA
LQKVPYLLVAPFRCKSTFRNHEKQINLKSILNQQFKIQYNLKLAEIRFLNPFILNEIERSFLLEQIDFSWKKHLQTMSISRETVGWRSYGQKNPLTEYKQDAYTFFILMLTYIRHQVIFFLVRSKNIVSGRLN